MMAGHAFPPARGWRRFTSRWRVVMTPTAPGETWNESRVFYTLRAAQSYAEHMRGSASGFGASPVALWTVEVERV